MPGTPDPDPAIDAAWQRVLEAWDDSEAHERFVGTCMTLGQLPEAGRRYREVRDGDPERSEEARRRIDRLLTLATRTLELTRMERPDTASTRRKILFFAMGLSLFMVGYVLLAWLR